MQFDDKLNSNASIRAATVRPPTPPLPRASS
jgi:hypothetical protein